MKGNQSVQKKAAAKPSWVFERTSPMGGAAGEAFTNTLAASDMLPEHVLGREAIQNSADAAADGKKVLVRFRSAPISLVWLQLLQETPCE